MTTLDVGTDKWPFPFPLVQRDGRWRFDSTAGVEEIVNRRVGANELSTIQSCLAFVDAEREYYVRNPQQDPLLHFAQKLVSSEGQKDGLYWPTAAMKSRVHSVKNSRRRAARDTSRKAFPRLRLTTVTSIELLKAQGPNAAGGAYDYMVRDKMLGGFALIASPAEYGSIGCHDLHRQPRWRRVLEGPRPGHAKAALSIEAFDPDQSWTREAAIE